MASRLVPLRRMAGASLANGIYLGLQGLLFVVMTPWLLHVLGPELYGLWTILMFQAWHGAA